MVLRQPLLEELIVYLRLARVCRERMETPVADRMLILGGGCAALLDLQSISRFCRQQIVTRNPGHQLARFPDFSAALRDPDFGVLLGRLAKKHPPDASAELLKQYDQSFPWTRASFSSDTEMAAAALGVDAAWIDACFGTD